MYFKKIVNFAKDAIKTIAPTLSTQNKLNAAAGVVRPLDNDLNNKYTMGTGTPGLAKSMDHLNHNIRHPKPQSSISSQKSKTPRCSELHAQHHHRPHHRSHCPPSGPGPMGLGMGPPPMGPPPMGLPPMGPPPMGPPPMGPPPMGLPPMGPPPMGMMPPPSYPGMPPMASPPMMPPAAGLGMPG